MIISIKKRSGFNVNRNTLCLLLLCSLTNLTAQINERVAKIRIRETAGFTRILQYVQVDIQIKRSDSLELIAEDINAGKMIPCQSFMRLDHRDEKITILSVIFPVSLGSFETKTVILRKAEHMDSIISDLKLTGEGTELIIENGFYRADLTRSEQSEAKTHYSGQLRELFVKMGFDQLFLRTENRMHWAPNFRKKGMENYYTISDWDNPQINHVYGGPYCIVTQRQDIAPAHPEILLSATYKFYASLPYFVFSSMMEVINDVWLNLLRNDEMTMDSLFTHVAYKSYNKSVVDLPFSTRYDVLKNKPIPADARWVCFYNENTGYAFGSIRITYDNKNEFGYQSPTYKPHTKISDGAGGGKYWNRCLIDDHDLFVPAGSRYYEQNAYLIFRIEADQKFEHIDYWSDRLRNPPKVYVIQNYH